MTSATKKSEIMPESKSAINPALKKLMEEECKLVEGKFKYYEVPGGSFNFCAGKYPGQPIFKAKFVDGQIYKVPLWVARHLNGIDKVAKAINGKINSCSYPTHGFKWDANKVAPTNQLDEQGIPVPIVGVAKRTQRVGFESLEFNSPKE